MTKGGVLAALALGALAGSDSGSTTELPARERTARVAASALAVFEHQTRARVLISADDVPAAHALGRALAAQRVFDHVPAVAATVTSAQLEWLRVHPNVRLVTLDEGGKGHLAEALPLAGFSSATAAGFTGLGVTVAIIDSGIDRAHPDFAGAVVDEACFCSSGCCPGGATEAFGEGSAPDENGHGTHVAGIVASRGVTTGRPGGAPSVNVIAIKVLDAHNAFCCISDLVAALDWLAATHPSVDVVNMSFGANGLFAGDCDSELVAVPVASAVSTMIAGGSVVVASSGNNGDANAMPAPACLADVVSVGAVWDEDIGPESILCSEPMTSADRIACFSNASSTLDMLAPGALVTSTWPGGFTRGRAGTSQAAPMVSACAALLKEAFPTAGAREIAGALRTSPVALMDERNGRAYPRLDCGAALQALGVTDAGAMDSAVNDAEVDSDGGAPVDAASDADAALEGGPLDGGPLEIDAATDDAASGSLDGGSSGIPDSAIALDASPTAPPTDGAAPIADASEPERPVPSDMSADPQGHRDGGRGCACSTAGSKPGPLRGLGWLAVGLALAFSRRRWRSQ